MPFSIAPGTWWEYREAYTEHLGPVDSTSEDVTKFEVRGWGGKLFIRQTGNSDSGSTPVEVGGGGLRFGVFTGEETLPLPLQVGAKARSTEGVTFEVEAEERVEVPSGVYLAFRCALRTKNALSLLWVAPGVGIVRQVEGRPGAHPDLERVLLRWDAPEVAQ